MKWGSILLAVALLLSVCTMVDAQEKYSIGLVFDVGGRGDKSFNDAAYRGLEWASQRLKVDISYAEPGPGGADRENLLRRMARSGKDLVIGVGFLFTQPIVSAARDFPDVKFACVDMDVGSAGELPPNVVALTFREYEGSFVVGAIAGMETQTNKVGFVGGMTGPLIDKFEAGYTAGVKYANPECTVLSVYAGDSPTAFADPARGYELAVQLNAQGCDIMYHAAGNTGNGVFRAAIERGFYVIGVDSNQNYLGYDSATGKNWSLTSMLKRVDVAVYLVIEDLVNNRFEGGVREYGLKDFVKIGNETYRALDFAIDDYNRANLDEGTIKKANEIIEKIVKGEIKVPKSMKEL